MRSILALALMLCLFAAGAVAQEETLFRGPVSHSGFGGPVVKYTSINHQGALLVGGRGGWILNHAFILGGGGYAIANDVNAPAGVMPSAGSLNIEFGYGGVELEYLFAPERLGHISASVLVGGGSTNYVKDIGHVWDNTEHVGTSDVVFVAEPAINAELNVTTWFRCAAGASYRLVTDVDQVGLKEHDLSGAAATLVLKFGAF